MERQRSIFVSGGAPLARSVRVCCVALPMERQRSIFVSGGVRLAQSVREGFRRVWVARSRHAEGAGVGVVRAGGRVQLMEHPREVLAHGARVLLVFGRVQTERARQQKRERLRVRQRKFVRKRAYVGLGHRVRVKIQIDGQPLKQFFVPRSHEPCPPFPCACVSLYTVSGISQANGVFSKKICRGLQHFCPLNGIQDETA